MKSQVVVAFVALVAVAAAGRSRRGFHPYSVRTIHSAYPVKVPHPVFVPIPRAVPVKVIEHVRIPVPRPVYVKVHKPVAVEVPRAVPYPVPRPVALEVPNHVPVEVPRAVPVHAEAVSISTHTDVTAAFVPTAHGLKAL
ncbi:Hypothetical predicted protein [Cloeon dipterum]|uniref:Uncharacterized protein n=1 Tax=Cloeon dipterum TaxID=197152 RepID=A0A8S1CLA7_9INSE|nr:Hypothetical predicted protein [Cloeon dipterum]